MSWLGPLLNNEIGDRLNLELRHEHLFFIQGDRVLKDIGYSEKGRRFSEIEFGKPIRTLEDLKKNGYWLVGGTYDPAVMEEALARQHDGYYYCFFSNQCQDWTDRLRRAAERLETERGLDLRQLALGSTNSAYYSKPVSPTEPASVLMGLLTLAVGVAAIVGRIVAGPLFTSLLGVLFLISAAAHVVYAFHARDWRNMLSILLTAAGLSVAGVLILLDRYFAAIAMGTLLTILIAVYGLGSVALGVFFRPLFKGLKASAGYLLSRKRERPTGSSPRGLHEALERAVYADFFGTRTSSLAMLCSPFTTRAMRPEERLSTGTLAISKSLRKAA